MEIIEGFAPAFSLGGAIIVYCLISSLQTYLKTAPRDGAFVGSVALHLLKILCAIVFLVIAPFLLYVLVLILNTFGTG